MRPTSSSDKVKQRVQYFLMNNKKFLPDAQIPKLRERLLELNEEQLEQVECISFKDPIMLLVISIIVGALGVDRFMLGDNTKGVLKLLVALLAGWLLIGLIWWVIDLFYIMNMTKENNYKKLEETFKLLEFQ